jgi:hypothetical protein
MKRSSCASGSEHQERQRQLVGVAAGGDPVLLHRLEERRLGLRRGPVDLVGEDQVGEHRPADEPEGAPPGGVVLLEDLGAGDVGRHQIGRELDPREAEVERLGQRRDEERLGQPGDADEQAVTAREQRGEQVVHDLALADHPLLDLADDLLGGPGDLGDRLEVRLLRRRRAGEGIGDRIAGRLRLGVRARRLRERAGAQLGHLAGSVVAHHFIASRSSGSAAAARRPTRRNGASRRKKGRGCRSRDSIS